MDDIAPSERELRVQLAGLYRIFHHLGWTELIYNHISAHVPDSDHFLINPYGLAYDEVTASNLVKVDLAGNIVGSSDHPINPAGFVIHSAIHGARHDVGCVAHTHTTAGSAVACQAEGLRGDNFYSCLVADHVAYHDFEGITVREGERARLVASLGDRNFLILRNHGLLACGADVAACFVNLWVLQRACEIQVATDSGGNDPIPIQPEAKAASAKGLEVMMAQAGHGRLEYAALLRRVDRIDPSYKD
ncbi:MAG: class II aldolase/adducin family protein [Sandaracinaceae bacterium]|nr:class II aldolase/adducin family protein [Sandaracinaceae bacterium]